MPWQTLSTSVRLVDLILRNVSILTRLSAAQYDVSQLRRELMRQDLDQDQMAAIVKKTVGNEILAAPPDVSNRPAFLHIMKTAGTSFHAALERAFGVPTLWMNLDVLRLLPPDVVSAAPLISGHVPWEGQKLIGQDRKYLTILRDPRARTLSHFHQIEFAPEVVAEVGQLTLDEFLFNPRWRCLCENYQVRQLGFSIGLEDCGKTWNATDRFMEIGPPFPPRHDFPLSSLFDSIQVEDWSTTFASAVASLNEIDTVLVTERLSESKHLLSYRYDVDFPLLDKLNSRVYRQFANIPERYQKRVLELNEADMELWSIANRRFETDLARARS